MQFASGSIKGGQRGAYAPPNHPVGAMLCSHTIFTPSLAKMYIDQEMDIRTFCVSQDREKPTDLAAV